jgi:hypothetical protein
LKSSRRILALAVALAASAVFLAKGPAATSTLQLHVPLPARAHQSFGVFTVRVRGRAARLPIRPLGKLPKSIRAAAGISPATIKGRVTTFTVVVAIDDVRTAARALSASGAKRELGLEVGSKSFPVFSERGVTGTCPPPGFAAMVKEARAGLRIGTRTTAWRRIALNAVDNSRRWCSTDPLLESQTFTGFSAVGVAAARLNDDAFADLVVLERPHGLLGFYGKGDGTFRPALTIALPAAVSPTAVVAVPGASGRSDLYVTDSGGPVQFVDGRTFRPSSLGFSATDGAAGNFDGIGGLNDVAFVDGHSSSFSVVLDEGAFPSTIPADTILSHVTAGDFNDDGKYDLAGAGPAGVAIATGDATGSFTQRGLAVQQPNLSTALRAAPLGANPDLVVATSTGVIVVDFKPDVSYSATPLQSGTAPVGVAPADVTGDGRLDVIALNQNAADMNVWVATASGYRTPVGIGVGGRPLSLAVGRFNGDTRADVAVATDKGLTILVGRRPG